MANFARLVVKDENVLKYLISKLQINHSLINSKKLLDAEEGSVALGNIVIYDTILESLISLFIHTRKGSDSKKNSNLRKEFLNMLPKYKTVDNKEVSFVEIRDSFAHAHFMFNHGKTKYESKIELWAFDNDSECYVLTLNVMEHAFNFLFRFASDITENPKFMQEQNNDNLKTLIQNIYSTICLSQQL